MKTEILNFKGKEIPRTPPCNNSNEKAESKFLSKKLLGSPLKQIPKPQVYVTKPGIDLKKCVCYLLIFFFFFSKVS